MAKTERNDEARTSDALVAVEGKLDGQGQLYISRADARRADLQAGEKYMVVPQDRDVILRVPSTYRASGYIMVPATLRDFYGVDEGDEFAIFVGEMPESPAGDGE